MTKNVGLFHLILGTKLSLSEVISFLFYSFLPTSLIFIPMATVMAIVATLGYLNYEKEIWGFYSTGRRFLPFLFFIIGCSVGSSIFSLFLDTSIIPMGVRKVLAMKEKLGETPLIEATLLTLDKEMYIWIGKIKHDCYGEDVYIWQLKEKRSLHAKKAKFFYFSEKNKLLLHLYDGIIYQEEKEKLPFCVLNFKEYRFILPVKMKKKEFLESKLAIQALSSFELKRKLEELKRSPFLYTNREIYRWKEELYERYALLAAPVSSAIFLAPIAVSLKVGGGVYSFALSNAIILVYYLLFIIAKSLSRAILFPTLLWFPNGIFLLVGLVLFFKKGSRI